MNKRFFAVLVSISVPLAVVHTGLYAQDATIERDEVARKAIYERQVAETQRLHQNAVAIADKRRKEYEEQLRKKTIAGFYREMVKVEGDTFSMGTARGERDEMPVHTVKLSSFMIGRYEVTQLQWTSVMGNNPSQFSNCSACPVDNVSWEDIQGFLVKLNELTGKKFRLPTESEWEFAARGGSAREPYKFSGSDTVDAVGWYDKNSDDKTHPVGQKKPNALGLYDMTGNVFEWCADLYGSYPYTGVATDPQGASNGSRRVLRGGSWNYEAGSGRVTYRANGMPDKHLSSIGFRLAAAIE